MFIVEKEYPNIDVERKIFEDETFISLVTSLFQRNKIIGSASEDETNKGHGVKNNGHGIFWNEKIDCKCQYPYIRIKIIKFDSQRLFKLKEWNIKREGIITQPSFSDFNPSSVWDW